MVLLLHPTHRKFIRLLRSYADRGATFNITDLDRERFGELFNRTSNAIERHKSIYKLIIEILNRNTSSEDDVLFTQEFVDFIEQHFARAERRKPCNTLCGIAIHALVQLLK